MIKDTHCGEYYHVLNRGNDKQDIFLDDYDKARFLFLILYFQSPVLHCNLRRIVDKYIKNTAFNIDKSILKEIVNTRYVELVGFVFMPNHFHLIVYESQVDGVSKYMQRVLTSYTKYFNTKYDRSGHLFQGRYKRIYINSDNQLSYLSAYQHRNPRELQKWKDKEVEYPWSSYQDYVKENRWGELLKNDIIMNRFEGGEDYNKFVQNSGAKEFFENNFNM